MSKKEAPKKSVPAKKTSKPVPAKKVVVKKAAVAKAVDKVVEATAVKAAEAVKKVVETAKPKIKTAWQPASKPPHIVDKPETTIVKEGDAKLIAKVEEKKAPAKKAAVKTVVKPAKVVKEDKKPVPAKKVAVKKPVVVKKAPAPKPVPAAKAAVSKIAAVKVDAPKPSVLKSLAEAIDPVVQPLSRAEPAANQTPAKSLYFQGLNRPTAASAPPVQTLAQVAVASAPKADPMAPVTLSGKPLVIKK